jgi:hypothetical protein
LPSLQYFGRINKKHDRKNAEISPKRAVKISQKKSGKIAHFAKNHQKNNQKSGGKRVKNRPKKSGNFPRPQFEFESGLKSTGHVVRHGTAAKTSQTHQHFQRKNRGLSCQTHQKNPEKIGWDLHWRQAPGCLHTEHTSCENWPISAKITEKPKENG